HGYSTHQGTSYNAFLILDEKNVLIDTVKEGFAKELLGNIANIIDPAEIDIVISNHTEMDHTGALPHVMHRVGEQKPLYCSKMGLKNLQRHFSNNWNYHAVENGETLNIGKRTLTFMETRMLHWPDSMFTYVNEDKILFSSDAFGQHYAGNEVFDDQTEDAIMLHAKKYFANILMLYSKKTIKLIEKVVEMGLELDMICPDHGIIWREDPSRIINAYARWCAAEPQKKAVVIYDSMWHSTEKMANAIVAGLYDAGVEARPFHIRKSDRSDIMTEVLDAKAVIVGSPTLNNQMFPSVADMLTYMKGLKPQSKIGAAFGSYGWSGESVKYVTRELETMKFDIPVAGLRVQYVPGEDALEQCVEFGRQVGKAVLATC
ncbi:MAG: MBL fold metallo-hydrolase, partial [Desulfobacterales bacterium]|nr:MBL fold metallo-hydrolase [Desulfobacterales bacterium]